MKRSADTLVSKSSVTENGCDQLQLSSGSGSGCGKNDVSVKPSHRISLRSSSSSVSINAPTSCPASATVNKPLHRAVTAGSSMSICTIDDTNTATQTKQILECGNGSLESTTGARQVITRLINARILQQDGKLLPGWLDLSGGIIVGIHFDEQQLDKEEELPMNIDIDDIIEIFDCQGKILSPGFIDIQLNGAYGVDFSNDGSIPTNGDGHQTQGLETKDILHVAKKLPSTGVTSFCPTMVSSSRETYHHILSLMRIARKQQQMQTHDKSNKETVLAHILGMHLEGPFFAPSKSGAHDKQHIVAPIKGMSSVEEVYGISQKGDEGDNPTLKDIDIITLAPELPGASDAIRSLTKNPNQSTSEADRMNDPHSVVVSCGHTEATYEDGITAISCGASLLTHLYNAMNPFHHRKPGLVGLLSSEAKLVRMGLNRPFFSMIVDGIHVHESAVCMAYQSHPHGCVLVTDAMAAMGLGDGEHLLGNMKVTITGDRATLAGKDVLAGSVVSMDTCVKRFHRFTGCSVGEALLCATLHPAMVLKRHEARYQSEAPIGILELGAKADIVLLNDDLDVLRTWVAGRVAFQSKNVQNNI